MIVEFFGPPGSGKTTFAHALSDRLRERGCSSAVVLSYQPGRKVSSLDPGGVFAGSRRVGRAILEIVMIGLFAIARRRELTLVAKLMWVLPPRRAIWFMRLSQYILRLSRSWGRASDSERVVIFDQAFVQAVCSLALFNQAADENSLRRALDLVPRADVVIRLDAPSDLLRARLNERLRQEAVVERLFEADLRLNLEAIPIVEKIASLLGKSGQSITRVSSQDQSSLDQALGAIEEEILSRMRFTRAREQTSSSESGREPPPAATTEGDLTYSARARRRLAF